MWQLYLASFFLGMVIGVGLVFWLILRNMGGTNKF